MDQRRGEGSRPFDLVIKGGTVVSGGARRDADVGIRDGRVVAVEGGLSTDVAGRMIDADGCFVLPGVVDAHVHPVYADDLAATSRTAAYGGVTTLIPFMGAFPSWGREKIGVADSIRQFVADAEQTRPLLDFGIHAAIDATDDLEAELPDLIDLGVVSFKFFMAYRARGMMLDDDKLVRYMDLIGKAGAIAAAHAENGAGIYYLEQQYAGQEDVPNEAFLRTHTDLLEAEAVFRAVALADAVGCPFYLPHLAVREGLEVLRIARREVSIPLFIETCPHYLLLTNDEVIRRGALAKIAPPLRATHDNDALWAGLASGEVAVVATDHAARTLEAKRQGGILEAPYGAGSIEHLLPLIYTEGVAKGRITIERLVQVLCENPARIFGLAPAKGRLEPGADADVAILDPRRPHTITAARHHSNADYSLYEGWGSSATVTATIRRGEILLENGELTQAASPGRYVAGRAGAFRDAAIQ